MSNINKYFNKISKKRDLSSGSNPEEERKKAREGSSTTSENDAADNEVFQQISSTSDNSDVLEYLKTLEVKISEIYNLSNDTRSTQIKGDKQLEDLTLSVKTMSDKFDEFEKDRKEKEKIIKGLKQEVSSLKERVEELEKISDDHEQYSRRNCLLLHGIEEEKDEVTDDKVISVLQEKMELQIDKEDLDRSHRIGKPSPQKKRPIIVKFARYNIRKSAYSHKKRLKNTGISITESLTAFRMEQLKKAREEHGFQNVWTHDGKILFKENGSNSTKLFYG